MIFAVEEINSNSALLPGVRLGYHIMDSCDHVHTSLRALLSLLTHRTTGQNTSFGAGRKSISELGVDRESRSDIIEKTRNKQKMPRTMGNESDDRKSMMGKVTVPERTIDSGRCLTGSPIMAVIGLASSSPTGAIAHILGPFSIPLVSITSRSESNDSALNEKCHIFEKSVTQLSHQVSYFATCACLTDKRTYPSFLRTVPSDLFQVRGLVELVTYFGWNWVGTVGTSVR